MKYRKRRLPWVLMVLGALMALWALFISMDTVVIPIQMTRNGCSIYFERHSLR